jgi:hypothetical protein
MYVDKLQPTDIHTVWQFVAEMHTTITNLFLIVKNVLTRKM